MKERPIIFNGEMVRAILEGRKTQHRVPIKGLDVDDNGIAVWRNGKYTTPGPSEAILEFVTNRCAYGKIGDRLWVREKHALYQSVIHIRKGDGRSFSEIQDGSVWHFENGGLDTIQELKDHIKLMTGWACEAVEVAGDRWRPSVQMPRWASRIMLEITYIRVEKLRDISESDAASEGFEQWTDMDGVPDQYNSEAFKETWDSIYGTKKGDAQYCWSQNPWVWVIDFKVVKS